MKDVWRKQYNPKPTNMSKTICVFGDSITFGSGDSEGLGWVGRLRKHAVTNRYDVKIYNCGVSGDNTNDLLKRFQVEAEARNPDVIIFAIGTNDSQYAGSRDGSRVSLKDFQKNLEKLTKQATQLSGKVIFVGLTTVDERKTVPWSEGKNYDRKNLQKYNSQIRDVAEKNGVLFIDVFDNLKKSDFADGLHPNASGYKKLFLSIEKVLKSKVF